MSDKVKDIKKDKDKEDNNGKNQPEENNGNDADIKVDETIEDDVKEEEKEPEMDEMEKLQLEKAELQDKYLRLYSEFENFRRRTNKEKFDLIDRAGESLIQELLPVMDDFERALSSLNESSDTKSILEGIQLIFNKFSKVLEGKGLKEIDCIEKVFDPEVHDAITKIPAPKKKLKGKVVDQIQKGYMLKDKVIRHSRVVVGE